MNPQPARTGRGSARRARGRSIIPRERLVSELMQSGESSIVLISAPAGFGKSTVLAEWERADPRPFAWLTLAERHDDPVLLTESIAGALAELAPVGEDVYLALNGSKEGALNVAVPRLLESLHRGDAPIVLALDDVHEAQRPGLTLHHQRDRRRPPGGESTRPCLTNRAGYPARQASSQPRPDRTRRRRPGDDQAGDRRDAARMRSAA